MPNRLRSSGAVRALGVELGRRVNVSGVSISIDDAPIRSVELGGGTGGAGGSGVTSGVVVTGVRYRYDARNRTGADVVVQGGSDGPVASRIEMEWSGSDGQWHSFTYP
jgi:hypothetical protein